MAMFPKVGDNSDVLYQKTKSNLKSGHSSLQVEQQ